MSARHDRQTDERPERPERPTVAVVVAVRDDGRRLDDLLMSMPAVDQVVLVSPGTVEPRRATRLLGSRLAGAQDVFAHVVVVEQTRPGVGNAYAVGLAAATTDVVVTMPADGSADADEVPVLVEALVDGADLALASRFVPEGHATDDRRVRLLAERLLARRARRWTGRRIADPARGFAALWRDQLPTLALPPADLPAVEQSGMIWGDGPELHALLLARLAAAGARIVEVPSVEQLRHSGFESARAVRRRTARALKRERALQRSGLRVLAQQRHLLLDSDDLRTGLNAIVEPTMHDVGDITRRDRR